jgi:hypothetical protein
MEKFERQSLQFESALTQKMFNLEFNFDLSKLEKNKVNNLQHGLKYGDAFRN